MENNAPQKKLSRIQLRVSLAGRKQPISENSLIAPAPSVPVQNQGKSKIGGRIIPGKKLKI